MKSLIEAQEQDIKDLDFNNRLRLLDLIEYTRNSSPGYGITNILENFVREEKRKEIKRLASDTSVFDNAREWLKRIFKNA